MDPCNGQPSPPLHTNDCLETLTEVLNDPVRILENIMISMGDGLSIQDLNMRIVYQNKFMIEQFGSHIGDYCYNVYEKRNTVCDGCPMIKSYETGQITKALRVGITRKGIPFRFENIASVMRNKSGDIIAGIELCRIVEEREKALDDLREAMQHLKEMQNQLVRAEKMAGIGQLAAGVAHEINNPTGFVMSNLNTIRKYINDFFRYLDSMEKIVEAVGADPTTHGRQDSIQEGVRKIIDSEDYRYLKDDLPEVIDESMDGLQRIKTIVTDLLTFSSSEEEAKRLVDINTEIRSVLELLDSEINKKGHVAKDLNRLPEISASPRQLQQLFVNLIHNAVQAIDSGGEISISTKAEETYIQIVIADDGVGIPKEVIPNIFNPFFTTREVGSGVGFGLSIAYRIIEHHNGNIDVQSTPGKGTTFTVRLPIDSTNGEHPLPNA